VIILKEKKSLKEQKLDEMAVLVVSSKQDRLPFKITVQSPDFAPTHARIRDLKTGKHKLGAFEVSRSMPRNPSEIKDYEEGVTDDMRQIIFNWAKLPNKDGFPGTNWSALYYVCSLNNKNR
jgi:hypothetical protein